MQSLVKNIKRVFNTKERTVTSNSLYGYSMYIASLTQSGTSDPVVTVLYNDLPLGTPVWTRASAGIYKATLNGSFLEAKTHMPFNVSVGSTTSIAWVLFGATGIEGYIYFDRESNNILRLTCVNAANVPADISSVIGTGVIMLPEVKVFN